MAINTKSFISKDPLVQYTTQNSLRMTKEQEDLNEATLRHSKYKMLGSPETLQLTSNLMKLIKAKKILDVGVYTGASLLSGALALPDDGEVYALDITSEYLEIGKPFLKRAGVEHKMKLFIGPAVETLQNLIKEGHSGTFDFAFIDADKVNIDTYYENCLSLVRPGGIIAIDNTIWFGRVIDENDQTEDTRSIRKLNSKLKTDDRIDLSFLMVGDGVSLCFKK